MNLKRTLVSVVNIFKFTTKRSKKEVLKGVHRFFFYLDML